MNATNMSKIKYLINTLPLHELESCIDEALSANNGAETRAVFVDYMERKGLGGFIRAGK
jgi:phosphotransferase system enzyme I (PtsP)